MLLDEDNLTDIEIGIGDRHPLLDAIFQSLINDDELLLIRRISADHSRRNELPLSMLLLNVEQIPKLIDLGIDRFKIGVLG